MVLFLEKLYVRLNENGQHVYENSISENIVIQGQLEVQYVHIKAPSCKVWNGMESWNGIVELNGMDFWNGVWNEDLKLYCRCQGHKCDFLG